MSKSVSKMLKNSFFQTFNVLAASALNFALMLAYARVLGPERLGSLVTSQAQVLIWVILIDFGMTGGLIATLQQAESQKYADERQGFRAFDLIRQVLAMRIAGAIFASGVIIFMAFLQAKGAEGFQREGFLQNIAFIPHLFAYAFHHTATAFALFRGRQALSMAGNLLGILGSAALAFYLALEGAELRNLLLAQSWGGFLATLVIGAGFILWPEPLDREDARQKQNRTAGPWKKNALRALWLDVWPHTVVLAVITVWSRLDQIAASHLLGFEAGGQYALSVRLVAIPVMIASAIHLALFPDLQRVGRDAPEKIGVYVGAVTKFLVRYGILLTGILLFLIAVVIVPILPKFRTAIELLPWFLPGICAYWIYNIQIGSLFGLRRYREIALTHIVAIVVYVIVLTPLTKAFGLHGVIAAYNIFSFSLFIFSFLLLKSTSVLSSEYRLMGRYSLEEEQFLRALKFKVLEMAGMKR